MKAARKILIVVNFILLIAACLLTPVLSWFDFSKEVLYYSPLSSPEAIYIGAGHIELRGLDGMTEDKFEDIRYLYFEGIDLTDGKVPPKNYTDHVICVFGRAVPKYMLQLGFTTNNGFEYELYSATETLNSSDPDIVVSHETHDASPLIYYYKLNQRINMNALNKKDAAFLGKNSDTYYDITFDTDSNPDTTTPYEEVQDNAIPIYYRTVSPITGNPNGGFVHYYILRIVESAKSVNDKETDIICIAARAQ